MGTREYTPNNLTKLGTNEIFVFGSNAKGIHGKGGAKVALDYFGAVYGKAEGIQGQSYAIITKKDWRRAKSSSLEEIKNGIRKMLIFAKTHQEYKFYVTKLGSSLAGYTEMEIRDLFMDLYYSITDNVILPKEYEVRDDVYISKSGLF